MNLEKYCENVTNPKRWVVQIQIYFFIEKKEIEKSMVNYYENVKN